MFRTIVYVLVVLQCLTLMQTRSKSYKLEIYNFTCQIMTERMKRFDCYYKKLTDNHYIFNQYATFSQDLGKDLLARIWIQLLPQNAEKPMNLLDVNLRVCEFLSKPFESQLVRIFLNELKRSSNIPRKCPFKGNYLYKVNNLTLNDDFFPPYSLFMNFSYRFELYNNNVLFAASTITGATVPNKK